MMESATMAPASAGRMPDYILALTLNNGMEGFYTGQCTTTPEGFLNPQMVLSVGDHEGAAAEALDQAFRGPLLCVARMGQILRNSGPPGVTVHIIEYHKAGGAP